MNLKRTGSRWDRNQRININDNWDVIEQWLNQLAERAQDLVAEGQLTEEQYAELITVINGHLKSGEVSKFDLTNELIRDLESINDKISKGNVGINDLREDVLQTLNDSNPEFNLLSIPRDGSTTPKKTTFAKSVSKNLFDGEFHQIGLIGASQNIVDENSDSRSIIIPIEPNTDYTVSRTSVSSNKFSVAYFEEYPQHHMSADTRRSIPGALSITLRSKENERYLVLHVSTEHEEPENIQIEKGTKATEYEDPSDNIHINLNESSIPNIKPDMLEFHKKSDKNMFDGKYDTGYYLAGTSGVFSYSNSPYQTIIFKADSHSDYTISKASRTNRFIVGSFEEYPALGTAATQYIRDDSAVSITISVADEKYLVVYLSTDGEKPHKLQIEKNAEKTEYEPYYLLDDEKIGVKSVGVEGSQANRLDYLKTSYDYFNTSPNLNQSDFREVNALYSFYDNLMAHANGDIIRTELGRDAVDNLPIYMYEMKQKMPKNVSQSDAPTILYISATHGHEKRTAIHGARFFYDLIHNWETNERLSQLRWNSNILIIPALNPYGWEHSTRKNENGVDLNRNFDIEHGADTDSTSSYYSGPYPFSEVSSQAIRDLLLERTDIDFVIDHHHYNSYPTYASDILWANTYTPFTKKLIVPYLIQVDAMARVKYNYEFEKEESLTSVYNFNTSGGQIRYIINEMGVEATIVETTENIFNDVNKVQVFGTDLIGNLILNVYDNL